VHKLAGTFVIKVVVSSRGVVPPNPIPQGISFGKGWQVFSVTVVIFDPTKGQVTGDVQLEGWNISDVGNQGRVSCKFTTSFTLLNTSILVPKGNTVLSWKGAGPNVLFSSYGAPEHLSINAATSIGYAAQWSGVGNWSLLPGVKVNYKVRAVDTRKTPDVPSKGDIFHIVINEAASGRTIFDSTPSALFGSSTVPVSAGFITVTDPPPEDVSAVSQASYDRQQNALIGVSVFCAILGIALIVSIIALVFFVQYYRSNGESMSTLIPKLGGK
jgi:hypothetical protein